MEWLITIGIIIFMYLIGKYAIEEGQRIESQKELPSIIGRVVGQIELAQDTINRKM